MVARLRTEAVITAIDQAQELYHRLVFLVAPAGAGKTVVLQEVSEATGAPLLNVNLELSRRMLDLTERQRALQLPRLLSDVVSASEGDVVLLDNIELLFDVSLKQDPLRLLQGLSRNKTVVAAWSGEIVTEVKGPSAESNLKAVSSPQLRSLHVVYAVPHHPEYRRYPVQDFLAIELQSSEQRKTS